MNTLGIKHSIRHSYLALFLLLIFSCSSHYLNSMKLHQSETVFYLLTLHDIQNNGNASKKLVSLIKEII